MNEKTVQTLYLKLKGKQEMRQENHDDAPLENIVDQSKRFSIKRRKHAKRHKKILFQKHLQILNLTHIYNPYPLSTASNYRRQIFKRPIYRQLQIQMVVIQQP